MDAAQAAFEIVGDSTFRLQRKKEPGLEEEKSFLAEEARIAKIEKSEAEAEIKFRQNYNADVARKREMNKYFNAKPGRKKSNGGLKPPKSSKKTSKKPSSAKAKKGKKPKRPS